jgi:hypothetical protein
MTLYTVGEWDVKLGREDEFAARWHELTEISLAEVEPNARVILLRDREQPRRFHSIGEFRNEETIVSSQDGCVLGGRLGDLADLLEHAQMSTLDLVDVIGDVHLR